MHDLNTMKRLNDIKAEGRPVNQARAGRAGAWVQYPLAAKPNGDIREHLPTICALLGSTEYEWKREEHIYIRRAQD